MIMIDAVAASEDAQWLTLDWADGRSDSLSAAFLRQNARDAWSLRELRDKGSIAVDPSITITELVEMGSAGVNVQFSDGHRKAIFPYVYLRELSEGNDK